MGWAKWLGSLHSKGKDERTPMTTSLITYHTSEGYQCKTKTAMVEHILGQIRKGNKGHFIVIKGCATNRIQKGRAKALAKAFLEKRVSAVMHGGGTVMVQSKSEIPLREAVWLLRHE
jgi:hypothetical protein